MGIMTPRWGEIGQIDVEMLVAGRTIVRRKGHHEVNGVTRASIAQVVQGALAAFVASGEVAATWARGLLMVSAIPFQVRCWEVLNVSNALGGV